MMVLICLLMEHHVTGAVAIRLFKFHMLLKAPVPVMMLLMDLQVGADVRRIGSSSHYMLLMLKSPSSCSSSHVMLPTVVRMVIVAGSARNGRLLSWLVRLHRILIACI